jgi:hypothetical protein
MGDGGQPILQYLGLCRQLRPRTLDAFAISPSTSTPRIRRRRSTLLGSDMRDALRALAQLRDDVGVYQAVHSAALRPKIAIGA